MHGIFTVVSIGWSIMYDLIREVFRYNSIAK
jgi:hypothetical protein